MKSMFGKVDRRGIEDNGQILSEMPAWTMEPQLNQMKSDLRGIEREINIGAVSSKDEPGVRRDVDALKERINDIETSKPEYSPSEKKFLEEQVHKMDADEGATLFPRITQQTGMKRNPGCAERESKLNDMPCLEVHPEIEKICNLHHVKNGKAPRNQIDKARRLIYELLGAYDNNGQSLGSREAIRRENAEEKSHYVTFDSPQSKANYDRIFNKEESSSNMQLRELQDEATRLKDEIAKLKDEKGNACRVDIPEDVPRETVKKKKPIVMWTCDECGEEMTTRQKGIHIARHRKQSNKLQEV